LHIAFSTYKTLRQHCKKQHDAVFISSTGDALLSSHSYTDEANAVDDSPAVDTSACAPTVDEFGVAQAPLKFLMALMASNSLPLSAVEFIRNSAQELIKDIVNFLKCRVMEVLQHSHLDMNTLVGFHELVNDFDGWQNPFYGIETVQQLMTYLKTKGLYNEAEPHVIGKRWEVKRDRMTQKQVQVEVSDTFYYVRIENTLRLILQQPRSWSFIDTRTQQAPSGLLTQWVDGDNGQHMASYCTSHFPSSIPIFIQIYFDEVETVNPLGSKTGIHKLGAFYFVVKNFPPVVNSSLHNIHLLALAHSEDLKRYTADAVMRTVVAELQVLHNDGLTVSVNGHSGHFRCMLSQVVGDNLGLHSLLGYVENFSRAKHACDLCMATQAEMQTVFTESTWSSISVLSCLF